MAAAAAERVLDGRVLLVTAERRAAELAAALERHGATIRHAPALTVIAHSDDAELVARTRAIIARAPDVVVVTTGIGLRGWLEAADAAGLGDQLRATLAAARLIARGPKARGALQANGLQAAWVAESETSAEIIERLTAEGVAGNSIVVQHHGAGDDGVHRALAAAGALVDDVVVYRWGPPADPELVAASAGWAAAGEVDGVLFTSAPAAAAWLANVRGQGLFERLRDRIGDGAVLLFCVGPVTARPLQDAGLATIEPERSRLGALIKTVVATFEARPRHDAEAVV